MNYKRNETTKVLWALLLRVEQQLKLSPAERRVIITLRAKILKGEAAIKARAKVNETHDLVDEKGEVIQFDDVMDDVKEAYNLNEVAS